MSVTHEIVIADASCLIGLQNIDRLDILQKLFAKIWVTPEVSAEFDSHLPEWIKIEEVKNLHVKMVLNMELDIGESSAIALSLEKKNSLLLIDEKKGRKLARSLGISILGTLGVLVKAKQMNVIPSLKVEIENLIQIGFYISDDLIVNMLELVKEN